MKQNAFGSRNRPDNLETASQFILRRQLRLARKRHTRAMKRATLVRAAVPEPFHIEKKKTTWQRLVAWAKQKVRRLRS